MHELRWFAVGSHTLLNSNVRLRQCIIYLFSQQGCDKETLVLSINKCDWVRGTLIQGIPFGKKRTQTQSPLQPFWVAMAAASTGKGGQTTYRLERTRNTKEATLSTL